MSTEKWKELKQGLDKELEKFEGSPLQKQLTLQRKLLDDETVAQVEYVYSISSSIFYSLII
jgi:hypothetical protein